MQGCPWGILGSPQYRYFGFLYTIPSLMRAGVGNYKWTRVGDEFYICMYFHVPLLSFYNIGMTHRCTWNVLKSGFGILIHSDRRQISKK